jgi:hypothetical protein
LVVTPEGIAKVLKRKKIEPSLSTIQTVRADVIHSLRCIAEAGRGCMVRSMPKARSQPKLIDYRDQAARMLQVAQRALSAGQLDCAKELTIGVYMMLHAQRRTGGSATD